MSDDMQLEELKSALAAAPTDLDLAWRYWNALGSWKGHDIRSGVHVFEAFRAAAMVSVAGVVAFARAYRELCSLSGEGPRRLDPELRKAFQDALPLLHGGERKLVAWVITAVDRELFA